MNECNYVTSSFQCKKIHGIPYYTTIRSEERRVRERVLMSV